MARKSTVSHALLTRDEFNKQVFARDRYTCLFCEKPAADAHHILDRKLWDNGGNYLNNGASVCHDHHLQCEQTLLSVEEIRRAANITSPIIPAHLNPAAMYDKWGNQLVERNGKTYRLKGELFQEENVQKILKSVNLLTIFKSEPQIPILNIVHGQQSLVMKLLDFKDEIVCIPWLGSQLEEHESGELPDSWKIIESQEHIGGTIWTDAGICLNVDETLEWFDLLEVKAPNIQYKGTTEDIGTIPKGCWLIKPVKNLTAKEYRTTSVILYT